MQATWEHHLNAKAFDALQDHTPFEPAKVELDHLDAAYAYCRELTYYHSRTFFMASALLPWSERRAMRALYAFCRVSDDIIDRAVEDPTPQLVAWHERAFSAAPPRQDLVAVAWADARARYNIPRRYGEQLLEGVSRDLTKHRYQTFDELTEYCYDVASTVGLMSMHIVGYAGEEAIPYAIKLGVALQMTNILRDVGEDLTLDRVYLPLEELGAFGLSVDDLFAGRNDAAWARFIDFQIARTHRLYAESLPGVALLHPRGRFAVGAAAELYRAILRKIERNNYNNFTRRAHLNKTEKIVRLPGIYWRARHGGYALPE